MIVPPLPLLETPPQSVGAVGTISECSRGGLVWTSACLVLGGQVQEATELSFRPQDVILSIDCPLELLEQRIYIFLKCGIFLVISFSEWLEGVPLIVLLIFIIPRGEVTQCQ